MTTITLKINERTKAGKAFLALADAFLKNQVGIEIITEKEDKQQSKDWWHTISDAEKQTIEQGLEDIKNERFTPHDQVMAELDSYINSHKK